MHVARLQRRPNHHRHRLRDGGHAGCDGRVWPAGLRTGVFSPLPEYVETCVGTRTDGPPCITQTMSPNTSSGCWTAWHCCQWRTCRPGWHIFAPRPPASRQRDRLLRCDIRHRTTPRRAASSRQRRRGPTTSPNPTTAAPVRPRRVERPRRHRHWGGQDFM